MSKPLPSTSLSFIIKYRSDPPQNSSGDPLLWELPFVPTDVTVFALFMRLHHKGGELLNSRGCAVWAVALRLVR